MQNFSNDSNFFNIQNLNLQFPPRSIISVKIYLKKRSGIIGINDTLEEQSSKVLISIHALL
jgi:hypothetical protein